MESLQWDAYHRRCDDRKSSRRLYDTGVVKGETMERSSSKTSGVKAQAIAVLGTGSDVGKSLVVAGLCRLLRRAGMRVAPFKAQNMSNNSFVTRDGKEIGRAQALQAKACGLDPHADMNPILLKPESDRSAQIVVQGTVWGKLDARNYLTQKDELADRVRESYDRLAGNYDVIVIEGAGSAAEINLRDRDLANWFAVQLADACVVLVADIDRGGVFAQVIGTLELLSPNERKRVIGVVINKFRGDIALFTDGVALIEQRIGIPVLGVVPFLRGLHLEQEDSMNVDLHRQVQFETDRVNIAVILLPRMSNFTDFNHLAEEEDVALRYAATPGDLVGADVVVIPGSKNTIEDLAYLQEAGFTGALRKHVAQKRELVGICGGYQMLGRSINDPHWVEAGGTAEGLGFLDVTTRLLKEKVTRQVEAEAVHLKDGTTTLVQGYFIHMGETQRGHLPPCFRLRFADDESRRQHDSLEASMDGASSVDGMVWGTYIHGIFDRPDFRRMWLNRIRKRRGLDGLSIEQSERITQRLNSELDRWADHLQTYVNIRLLFKSACSIRV